MRKPRWMMGILAAAVLGAGIAQADVIYFSGSISDNDGPDPAAFVARADWTYLELDQILCVTIYNDTTAPNAYTISQFNFNASDAVLGLALIDNPLDPLYNADYPEASSGGSSNAGGFGGFDWSLDLGQGNNGILAGNSSTFYFAVDGDFLTAADFFSHGTDKAPTGGVAIIHFTRGPNDDSVWGIPGSNPNEPPGSIIVIPEPASMTLLGLGIAALMYGRTRRRSN